MHFKEHLILKIVLRLIEHLLLNIYFAVCSHWSAIYW